MHGYGMEKEATAQVWGQTDREGYRMVKDIFPFTGVTEFRLRLALPSVALRGGEPLNQISKTNQVIRPKTFFVQG